MVNTAKNFLLMLNHLQQMHLKLLQKKQKTIQTAEATGDLIGNIITDRITKVSKASPQNSSEIKIKSENDKEIPKERYVSAEERQKIIDDLGLI